MRCPFCGSTNSSVLDTRTTSDSLSIRRRRICEECDRRFTTYERTEIGPLRVIKTNGERQSYDRSKIKSGLLRACEKRPISNEMIEALVDRVEKKLRDSFCEEIPSKQIGEYVMEELKNIDEISYVRFASVYRKFQDIDTFLLELNKMKNKEDSNTV